MIVDSSLTSTRGASKLRAMFRPSGKHGVIMLPHLAAWLVKHAPVCLEGGAC